LVEGVREYGTEESIWA